MQLEPIISALRQRCPSFSNRVMEIEPADGWQETELGQLPHFDGGTIKVDAIDPADPNKANPVLDGRYEAGAVLPKTGNLA